MICDGKMVVLTYTNKIQSYSISVFAWKKENVKWSQLGQGIISKPKIYTI